MFACIDTVLSLKILDYIITMSRGGPGDASEVLTYQLYKISFINLDLGYGAAMSFFLLSLILVTTYLIYLVLGQEACMRHAGSGSAGLAHRRHRPDPALDAAAALLDRAARVRNEQRARHLSAVVLSAASAARSVLQRLRLCDIVPRPELT